jgi:P pilus assembly chaperone PapD
MERELFMALELEGPLVSLSALPPTSKQRRDQRSTHLLLLLLLLCLQSSYKQAPFSVALSEMQVETMGKRSASEISSTNGEEEVEAMVRRQCV